jgi:hypothetical protein
MNARAISLLLASLCLGASGLQPNLAWGQSNPAQSSAGLEVKPIGKVINATGSATIEHKGAVVVQANLPANGVGQAKADDPVYLGDLVQTGANSALGIVFIDGSSFSVSSNARMELNEFIYDPKGDSNSTLFNLSKGTFTFLAGRVAKTGSMKVETPVGTMGIRGTAPRVEILDDGTVKFSNLVEENKAAKDNRPGPGTTPAQRRAENPSSFDSAASQKAEKDLDKRLKICQGC